MTPQRAISWRSERRANLGFLGAQFCVCVGTWLVVVLIIEGSASTSGLVASVVTGVVLMIVSWVAIKVGWDLGPTRVSAAGDPGSTVG